jgi:hypothetical protein
MTHHPKSVLAPNRANPHFLHISKIHALASIVMP